MSSPAPATTRIALAPTPGFCVKSAALNAALLTIPGPDHATTTTALPIPIDRKVFVNIAWDKHVPAPPARSEAAIERAVAGDVALASSAPADPEDWYVPVIVPEPRADTDKAGKPSVVFDCIFSASLKPRALRSPEFKTFLVELAFQRIETQYGLQLSRQIGTPNIAAKGKLAPRTVSVPTALLSPAPSPSPLSADVPLVNPAGKPSKPLIEEVSAPAPAAKGILKTQGADVASVEKVKTVVPSLSWSETEDGRLRIALSVPHLTHASIPHTTLDLEPRRVLFSAPSPSPSSSSVRLDLDLALPDAEIERVFTAADEQGAEAEKSGRAALTLKRERPLDVDGARAEWRVGEGLLVIYA
ncbi:PIH1 domain-containing protein 1 [Trametes pubescens]|uniref:PIH1 domain-containing protein 1 n=1 Tax=Trametes pubescens TaxID=154538 RepID=A0A1M2V1X3_TRAPU|nr:PIH1 domain-containing protein 1 [Trametes pubescens]